MKSVVLFYHKNIDKIYKPDWIRKCVISVKNQTLQDFTVFELNYGGGPEKHCEGIRAKYYFLQKEFNNHIGAMNYLYDLAFSSGYDVVFNVNMDDNYSMFRFEQQLKAIENGSQLVSSNFCYVKDDKVIKTFDFSNRDIKLNLARGHNLIAHPVIAMHKSFWTDGLRYNDVLGHEDLDLWCRAIAKGKKFKILNQNLLFYRLHANQVTKFYKS